MAQATYSRRWRGARLPAAGGPAGACDGAPERPAADQPAADAPWRARQIIPAERRRGRGALINPDGRFEPCVRELADDGWGSLEDLPPLRTEVTIEKPRTIITRNASPDISFDRSVNPYRGCEHGCVYCFARPTHAYMGLSPGLDFETRLFAKPDAAKLLEKELAAKGYAPRVIAMGTNTDPYQPIEKRFRITRQVLEVLERCNHPVGIVTKSALITRDIDILARMAARNLVKVALSVTTLDPALARSMEPRAATPAKRLAAMRSLAGAGVPVAVMTAPVIPGVNDDEIERILEAAHAAGAREAGYVMLRLPHEVRDSMWTWLETSWPEKARRARALMRQSRGGRDYDAAWGERMTGSGPYAWMTGRRFQLACARIGLNQTRLRLDVSQFRPPSAAEMNGQMSLFGADEAPPRRGEAAPRRPAPRPTGDPDGLAFVDNGMQNRSRGQGAGVRPLRAGTGADMAGAVPGGG